MHKIDRKTNVDIHSSLMYDTNAREIDIIACGEIVQKTNQGILP